MLAWDGFFGIYRPHKRVYCCSAVVSLSGKYSHPHQTLRCGYVTHSLRMTDSIKPGELIQYQEPCYEKSESFNEKQIVVKIDPKSMQSEHMLQSNFELFSQYQMVNFFGQMFYLFQIQNTAQKNSNPKNRSGVIKSKVITEKYKKLST